MAFLRVGKNKTASVLVIALWSLVMLTILAASLGLGMRQKITLLARLDERAKIQLLAEAGVKKAITLLNRDLKENNYNFSPAAKMFRGNNALFFSDIHLPEGRVFISHDSWDGLGFTSSSNWGMTDEESKLNCNKATVAELQRLVKAVLNWEEKKAQDLAQAIVDWREYGESELKGFYSDEYYGTADHPYSAKNENYEILDELLLIKGMTPEISRTILPYLTVYGSGRVNINTASRPVLLGLGLDPELADKILFARRGKDQIEATLDDYIFVKTYDLASELSQMVQLTAPEIATIDRLNRENKLETNSTFYLIRARAVLKGRETDYSIESVFDSHSGRIVYWKEEY